MKGIGLFLNNLIPEFYSLESLGLPVKNASIYRYQWENQNQNDHRLNNSNLIFPKQSVNSKMDSFEYKNTLALADDRLEETMPV